MVPSYLEIEKENMGVAKEIGLIRERRRKESELLLRFGKERDFDNLI
jgi:hypothetical protein